jgi:hypothetical protein
MRFVSASSLVVASLLSSAAGLNHLVERTDITTDVCGEVDGVLKVPNLLLHGKSITIGKISKSRAAIAKLRRLMARFRGLSLYLEPSLLHGYKCVRDLGQRTRRKSKSHCSVDGNGKVELIYSRDPPL